MTGPHLAFGRRSTEFREDATPPTMVRPAPGDQEDRGKIVRSDDPSCKPGTVAQQGLFPTELLRNVPAHPKT
jgi:hypothetical protein